MATLNILQQQRNVVVRMLHLNESDSIDTLESVASWKVLVFDQFARDVLAPLLNVADLRKLGITLNMCVSSVVLTGKNHLYLFARLVSHACLIQISELPRFCLYFSNFPANFSHRRKRTRTSLAVHSINPVIASAMHPRST